MAKFCGKCGSKLDKTTGLCPKCDADKIRKRKKRKILKRCIGLAAFLLLVCIGGLESDENCHTFDADRNVIPGLYVAGNVQGNRFATEYPIGLKGVSHSMAMYYGYVAGKNAMQSI